MSEGFTYSQPQTGTTAHIVQLICICFGIHACLSFKPGQDLDQRTRRKRVFQYPKPGALTQPSCCRSSRTRLQIASLHSVRSASTDCIEPSLHSAQAIREDRPEFLLHAIPLVCGRWPFICTIKHASLLTVLSASTVITQRTHLLNACVHDACCHQASTGSDALAEILQAALTKRMLLSL